MRLFYFKRIHAGLSVHLKINLVSSKYWIVFAALLIAQPMFNIFLNIHKVFYLHLFVLDLRSSLQPLHSYRSVIVCVKQRAFLVFLSV